jgi:hypothetical protein
MLFLASVAACGAAAAQPLPELRTEPVPAGSVFFVRNTAAQPVSAILIELVNYPGSSFTLLQDECAGELIAPGAEKRIPVTNMTVGAVPDYVKLQAAIFADGSTAGTPAKVARILESRRSRLAGTRELIARIEKGASPADLKQWADSLPAARRSDIVATTAWLEAHSPDETLTKLRATERLILTSKPPL